MITLHRTDSTDPQFIELVKHLDVYLAEKDGKEHDFYAQYNKIDQIKHVIVAKDGTVALACGAIKEFSSTAMEVKRMYTSPLGRNKGIASQILLALELWAAELGYQSCVLETGKKQIEAIALYQKNGYQLIPNYGQYIGIENSVCFEKCIG
jgi:putative acetyltransferase